MEIKVVHIFRSYLPITENWLYLLISHIKNVKHIIFAEKIDFGPFYNDSFSYYTLPKQKNNKSFIDICVSALSKYIILFKFYHKKQAVIRLQEVIKVENPDIIHVHFGVIALPYMPVFISGNIPFFVSFYGYDYNTVHDYRALFRNARFVICEGNAGKQQLISLGCPSEKIKIIPLGVILPEQISPKSKPENQLHLIQIASFTEKKGHIYTIKAFQKAFPYCPGMTLTLLGPENELKNELKKFVKSQGLDSQIFFVDAIPPNQIVSELKKYDIFIHPSVTAKNGDNEGGAPVVLLQAQSCGLPVISTFHKDIPSYVMDKASGMLAAEKDIETLCSFIIHFYKMDEKEFAIFSENAICHVSKHYNIVSNAENLKSLYYQLI